MIPVYEPWMTKLEEEYAAKAVASTWISNKGEFVDRFAEEIKKHTGFKYVLLTTTGTAACHVLMHCIGEKQTIAIPALTYVASANAALYENHSVHVYPVDVDNWNMIGPLEANHVPFPTYLYGCTSTNVEHEYADAAQAFHKDIGLKLKAAAFSFFANKLITTGQGGAFCTNDKEQFYKAKMFINHYRVIDYFHAGLGNNYAMSNVNAAIGCAQMARYDEIKENKTKVMRRYEEAFANSVVSQKCRAEDKWMYAILVENGSLLVEKLRKEHIETRTSFYPLQTLKHITSQKDDQKFEETYRLFQQTLILPSYPTLSTKDQDLIIKEVFKCLL